MKDDEIEDINRKLKELFIAENKREENKRFENQLAKILILAAIVGYSLFGLSELFL